MNRVALLMELTGWLNVGALQKAISDLVARHEALRTAYHPSSSGFRQELRPAAEFNLRQMDLKSAPADRRPTIVWEVLNAEINQPARLDGDMLFFTLFDMGNGVWLLGGYVYHIAFDGGSVQAFWADLFGAYRNRVLGFADNRPPPLQYADYALWEKQWLTQSQLDASYDFWRSKLAKAAPLLLPNARPSNAPPSIRGQLNFQLSGDEFSRVRDLAREARVTINILFLAAVAQVTAEFSGSPGTLIGNITQSRPSGFDKTVGCFMQPRAIWVDLSDGAAFSDIIARTRKSVIETSDIRRPPPQDLLSALEAQRVMVNYTVIPAQQAESAEKSKGGAVGLHMKYGDLPQMIADRISRDLQFSVTQRPDGLQISVHYAADKAHGEWVQSVGDAVRTRLLNLDQ